MYVVRKKWLFDKQRNHLAGKFPVLFHKACNHKCPITFSLVPTPSVPEARRGSLKPAAFKSKRPAKPPRSTVQPVGQETSYLLILNDEFNVNIPAVLLTMARI